MINEDEACLTNSYVHLFLFFRICHINGECKSLIAAQKLVSLPIS
jgi:hypothetical protein